MLCAQDAREWRFLGLIVHQTFGSRLCQTLCDSGQVISLSVSHVLMLVDCGMTQLCVSVAFTGSLCIFC